MNLQRFDDSTLIRIFALHQLHDLKEHGLTRGALIDYHSRYKLIFWRILSRYAGTLWPVRHSYSPVAKYLDDLQPGSANA